MDDSREEGGGNSPGKTAARAVEPRNHTPGFTQDEAVGKIFEAGTEKRPAVSQGGPDMGAANQGTRETAGTPEGVAGKGTKGSSLVTRTGSGLAASPSEGKTGREAANPYPRRPAKGREMSAQDRRQPRTAVDLSEEMGKGGTRETKQNGTAPGKSFAAVASVGTRQSLHHVGGTTATSCGASKKGYQHLDQTTYLRLIEAGGAPGNQGGATTAFADLLAARSSQKEKGKLLEAIDRAFACEVNGHPAEVRGVAEVSRRIRRHLLDILRHPDDLPESTMEAHVRLVPEAQAGFMAGRRGLDIALQLSLLLDRAREEPIEGVALAALDWAKAYKRVDWDWMEACLKHQGVPPSTLKRTLSLYGDWGKRPPRSR
ncbi:hypothetical protein CBOM_01114 [Ceraceosorus bombacis]|uniref:Uncharacterized protein n=1 Tax=Ceraceosorus bombacis TaxID=401625 RepID=A0A0P1BCY0_9BASI|nr:hypothetical protein CBOM_01114 [Ceraceosorus bombacis]